MPTPSSVFQAPPDAPPRTTTTGQLPHDMFTLSRDDIKDIYERVAGQTRPCLHVWDNRFAVRITHNRANILKIL